MPIKAGDLRDRFRFEGRALDANGDRTGDWGADAVTLAARFVALKGSVHTSEVVMSERLQGRQPAILTVRRCVAALKIDSTFRATDVRSGDVYAVKSAAPNTEDRNYRDVLVQAEGTHG